MSQFVTLIEAPNSATKAFHKTTYPALDPKRPELSLKGKTIVITGGGTGIGAASAEYFAKAGASLIAILGRREQPLLETKAHIESLHPETSVLALAVDATDKAAVDAAFQDIAAASSSSTIDVLVANAAVLGPLAPIADADATAWLKGVTTNLGINLSVTSAFLAHGRPDGIIIETSSNASHMDIAPGFSAYAVAKLATARFYQLVQFEYPQLRVYTVQPGAIKTDMAREAGYQEQNEGEASQWLGRGTNLIANYDHVSLAASFYVWLCSPEAEFLKGRYLWANWDVDELMSNKDKILAGEYLRVGLQGWPFE
ncbi:hypothetical protein ACEQ8H_008552 [Pleosporales sp. CAS-2024a]